MLRSISIMLHARSGFLSFNFSHECPSSGPSPSPWRLLLNRLHPRALGGIGVGLVFNLCLVEVKPADAFTLFSGVDINDSGNNTPLTSFPNSDQARDLFFSRLSSIGTETFEGFTGSAGGTAPPDPFSIGFAVPGGTLDATIVDEGDSARIYNEPDGNGAFAISGWNYVRFTVPRGGSGTSFQINLSQPAGAFGFYTTDLNPQSGLVLEVSNNDGLLSTLTAFLKDSDRKSGSVTYFGFLADSPLEQFTQVRFVVDGTNDVIGFDDFSVGSLEQVQPVPGPLPLLGVGAAFGWSRKMRQRLRPRR